MKINFLSVLTAIGLVLAAPLMAKEHRTYYTPSRIEAAKANVAQHDWAKEQFDRVLNQPPFDALRDGDANKSYRSAKYLISKSNDEIYAFMPPITVARKSLAKGTTLCPIHGDKIRKRSAYMPWKFDFENKPWKLICPIGGESYPSNDFAAGDLTSGDYPDDGNGFVDGDNRHEFVRFYAHRAYLYRVIPSLRALSRAYLITGDDRYGEKCAVLLAAVAANFPGPKYHSEHCYKHSYKRRSGMVTDYIWECITLPNIALAYDAIWPIYEKSPKLLAFLNKKGLHPASPAKAREFVEDHIFRQGMQALLDVAIQGNAGHHQLAAITIALVLDDFNPANKPNSTSMVDFTYYTSQAPSSWVFSNFLTRDGGGFEGPAYDRIKFDYVRVAKRMEILRKLRPDKLSESQYPNLLKDPKLRAMYDFYIDVTLLDAFTPELGDAGGARLRPGFIPPRFISAYPHFYLDGFRLFRDSRYATALLGVKKQMPAKGQLFEPSIEAEARAAAKPISFATRLIDHYGLAYLRGKNAEVLTNYSALKGHYQDDGLALYLYAHELAMLPDLGYPFGWDYRWQWDANSLAHNTVTVDGAPPLTPPITPRGWVSLIGKSQGVQASITAHDCYNPRYNHSPFNVKEKHKVKGHPPVDRYERITVLIDEDEINSYAVDLFIVEGGKQHDQSWHSALRDPVLPDLNWQTQESGTAAGPDVAFNTPYTNLRGREVKNGMCFVTKVKRASVAGAAMFDWDFKLGEPAGLRLHVAPVDGPVKLIYGTGRSPTRPKDWQLPLLFVRREGEEGLKSRFLTILEPYRGTTESRITDIKVEGKSWPLIVTVQRGDATDIITINAPSTAGVLQRGDKRDLSITVKTGEKVVSFGSPLRGQITKLNRTAKTITLNQSATALKSTQPWVRIFSDSRSSMYCINQIRPIDDNHCQLILKETSLLGIAKPIKYVDSQIKNGAPLPFVTGSVDEKGNFVTGTCRWEGARVENSDASVSLRLAGVNGQNWIIGNKGYDLYIQEPITAEQLKATFGDANRLPIHDYGVGDSIEIIRTLAK